MAEPELIKVLVVLANPDTDEEVMGAFLFRDDLDRQARRAIIADAYAPEGDEPPRRVKVWEMDCYLHPSTDQVRS